MSMSGTVFCGQCGQYHASLTVCPNWKMLAGTTGAVAGNDKAPLVGQINSLHGQNYVCECHDCTQARSLVQAGGLGKIWDELTKALNRVIERQGLMETAASERYKVLERMDRQAVRDEGTLARIETIVSDLYLALKPKAALAKQQPTPLVRAKVKRKR